MSVMKSILKIKKEPSEIQREIKVEKFQQFLCLPPIKLKIKIKSEDKENSPENAKNNFKCKNCDRILKSQKSLESHQCSICEICNKNFFSKQTLQRHLEGVHKDPKECSRYECDLCGFKPKHKQEIKNHIIENHSNEIKKFSCYHCGKNFATKRNMTLHLKCHEKVACSICKKIFLISSLKDHFLIHKGKKKFECDKCGQKFPIKAYLKVHMQSHQNLKCHFCDKNFKTLKCFRSHLKFHENPNIFACKICGTQMQANPLRTHMKAHKKNSKFEFKCQKCVFGCDSKEKLDKHFYNNHRVPKFGRRRNLKKLLQKNYLKNV